MLGDSAHAMAPTAGLGFLLGITNALHLAGYLKMYIDDIPAAIKQYSESIAAHSKACLNYTTRLTELFYVDTPMKTAVDAKEIYAELYQLCSEAASHAEKFYISVLERDVEASTLI